jgi:hypothetical protein
MARKMPYCSSNWDSVTNAYDAINAHRKFSLLDNMGVK